MNIKDYISSGMVESYVLGLASEEERREFEQLCVQYPELTDARNEFELSIENLFMNEPAIPVASMKEKIMQSVRNDASGLRSSSPLMHLEKARARRKSDAVFRLVAAAASIVLLLSAYAAFNFYMKNKDLRAELSKTKQSQTEMNKRMKKLEEEARLMSDPNVAVVNMVGTQTPGKATANIFWDSTSSDVYLVVKNMPQLPSDKQYQLWAIINGQPKDLGLFDVEGNKKIMLRMKNTQKADAFAITIETRGNTGGPTLERMHSQGKPL